jgi:hypothetical protein
MKTLIAGLCVLLFAVQFLAAQDISTVRADAKEAMKAILEESRLGRAPVRGQDKRTGPITIEAVSAADVGEPDSFGKNALFLGIAQSGIVIIDPTCDPASTGRSDRMIIALRWLIQVSLCPQRRSITSPGYRSQPNRRSM